MPGTRHWMLALVIVSAWSAVRADVYRDLDRGKVLVYSHELKGSTYQEVVVKAVINAPLATVWRLVTHCDDFERTLPRIKSSVELSRKMSPTGERVVCKTTVDMPFPYSDLTGVTEAEHTVREGYRLRRWWHLRGDYKENKGSWELKRFKGDARRTLLVYRAVAVPTSWVPGWIRRAAQRRALPDMIKRLRKLSR